MRLLRLMADVSPAFQLYLETQSPERQNAILSGVRKFTRDRIADPALEEAYADSMEGFEDPPAGSRA